MNNPSRNKVQPGLAQTPEAVSSGGAASHQTWRNIRLVAGREVTARIRGRGYRIITVILICAVVVGAFIPTIVQYITARAPSQTSVAILNNAGLAQASLLSTANTTLNGLSGPAAFTITLQQAAEQAALLAQVKDRKLGILLVLDRDASGNLQMTDYASYAAANDPNGGTIYNLAALLTFQDSAQKLGLTTVQTTSLMAPPDLTSVNTQQAQGAETPSSKQDVMDVFAIIGSYLMLYAVLGYAGSVSQGVTQEKSSRVMEILVNATTPFQLLAGKIIGIAVASLTQMACMVVFGIGAMLIQTPLQARLFGTSAGAFTQFLTAVSIPAYLFFLLYFLLNFFLYAALFAGLGAMAARPEEVAGGSVIATIMLILGFFGFFLEFSLPNAGWVKLLSYIPFFTSPLMFGRLALGNAAWWEVVLSILLMLASIYVCTLGAVRIYRHAVLNYGQRPGLGGLLRLARQR